MSSKPPVVQIGIDREGRYAVSGFPEFERWMGRNEPLYAATYQQALYCGISETDLLRLLVAVMSVRAMELRDAHVRYVERAGLAVCGPYSVSLADHEIVSTEELTRLREAAAYGAMAREVLERTGNANPLEFV